jgi:hypothetical protein
MCGSLTSLLDLCIIATDEVWSFETQSMQPNNSFEILMSSGVLSAKVAHDWFLSLQACQSVSMRSSVFFEVWRFWQVVALVAAGYLSWQLKSHATTLVPVALVSYAWSC